MLTRSFMVIALMLAAGLAVVALRVQIVQEGYEIQRLEARRARALYHRRDLDSKMANTVTATKADQMNKDLGLGLQPAKTLPKGAVEQGKRGVAGEQANSGTSMEGGRP
jgi:hypothetical protein